MAEVHSLSSNGTTFSLLTSCSFTSSVKYHLNWRMRWWSRKGGQHSRKRLLGWSLEVEAHLRMMIDAWQLERPIRVLGRQGRKCSRVFLLDNENRFCNVDFANYARAAASLVPTYGELRLWRPIEINLFLSVEINCYFIREFHVGGHND